MSDDKGYEGKNVFKKESEDDGLKLLNLTIYGQSLCKLLSRSTLIMTHLQQHIKIYAGR